MCCQGTKQTTKKFLATARGRKGFYAWKIIHSDGESLLMWATYSPGTHYAKFFGGKRKTTKVYNKGNPRGIHIYLNYPQKQAKQYGRKIVRVFCEFRDVICSDDKNKNDAEAVLMKIKIHKSDWKKAGLK